MEEREIEKVYRSYRKGLKDTPLSFTRFLYEKINWNDRLQGCSVYLFHTYLQFFVLSMVVQQYIPLLLASRASLYQP